MSENKMKREEKIMYINWIHINNKKPDKDIPVLVLRASKDYEDRALQDRDPSISIGYYDNDLEEFVNYNDQYLFASLWHPLPEMPKDLE